MTKKHPDESGQVVFGSAAAAVVVFVSPGKWTCGFSSTQNCLDSKVPVNGQGLSRH